MDVHGRFFLDRSIFKHWVWKREDFRMAMGREPLRATLYRRDNRALLVVVNFVKQTRFVRAMNEQFSTLSDNG